MSNQSRNPHQPRIVPSCAISCVCVLSEGNKLVQVFVVRVKRNEIGLVDVVIDFSQTFSTDAPAIMTTASIQPSVQILTD